MTHLLSHSLTPGGTVGYWQIGTTVETRYDVPDVPMTGDMDPFFFLTKDKNYIPHEYPCRTQFSAERRNRRPKVTGAFRPVRNWLPFGSPRLDLSGFWFRPMHLSSWASTVIRSGGGKAHLRLRTCGGAVLFANGREAGWMSPYRRNAETCAEFSAMLDPGDTRIEIFFDDLAERDTRYYLQLDYLDGPEAKAGIPLADNPGLAQNIETALATMHFDRPAYAGGEVAFLLPHPIPVDMAVDIRIEGDFLSHHGMRLGRSLPASAERLSIAQAADISGDFRHVTLTMSAGGFAAARTFGVEIFDPAPQSAVPGSLADRIEEALNWVAEKAEPDTVAALARLAQGLGGVRSEAMIAAMLPRIEDCWDCADFALVPLIWARVRFGALLSQPLRDRIDAAMLGYRYWMDEPGNDVQWYFSENHALLFHTSAYLAGHHLSHATFRRSGRLGVEQTAVGRDRVRAWLDHFEEWEMAEFNSAPYFPIDLKGLTALYALAPDADIAKRAGRAVLRLLEVVANSAHHGAITAAQGRSYEHSLRAGRTLELSAITRMLWGIGHLGSRFHALPGLALAIRDHGLSPDDSLAARANWVDPSEQEWAFSQGQGRYAALYHAKSRDWAMGSAAAYRWFEWGYQETLVHARIGENPEAQVWINHPGEVIHSGYGRPSYWGGSASVPRCQQYRGLALVWFDGQPEQPDFTHAWFPASAFDEVWYDEHVVGARSGRGAVLLIASAPLERLAEGPTAGCEVRLAGRKGLWIVRTGETAALASFVRRFRRVAPRAGATVRGGVAIDDPDYGLVLFRSDGTIAAERRDLRPEDWSIAGMRTILPAAT